MYPCQCHVTYYINITFIATKETNNVKLHVYHYIILFTEKFNSNLLIIYTLQCYWNLLTEILSH